MSSLSLPQPFLQGNASTTTFRNWDATVQKITPRAQIWDREAKPLPPTPTRPGIPSSKFHVYVENLSPQGHSPASQNNTKNPRKAYQKSKGFSSSTSNLFDKLPPRPQVKRAAKTEIFAGPMKQRKPFDDSIFREWRAPKYESSDDEADRDSPPLGKSMDSITQQSNDQPHVAEQHAAEYISVLHACDALLPSFDTASYSKDYSKAVPPCIPGSVDDAVNDDLVPHALRLSTSDESQLSSYFSSDSDGSDDEGVKKNFRLRARRVFHARKSSREKAEKASKTVSLTPSERDEIQESIYNMYDTLTRLSDPSAADSYI